MNKKGIIEEITNRVQGNEPEDWDPNLNYQIPYYGVKEDVFEYDGYKISFIKEVGGEGDGAPVSYIFKVKKGKEIALFRIDGYYSSWDSNCFDDDAYEVEEYIKQVKDWRKVK